MNDLKLIGFEKPKWNFKLFLCVIVFMFSACKSEKKANTAANDSVSLPITYVTTSESNKRQDWFFKYKYPVLDAITLKDEGEHETRKLDFKDLEEASTFFDLLIAKAGVEKEAGVRVYFASHSLTNGNGRLTLIFNNTTGTGKIDVENYYAFKDGVLLPKQLDFKTAQEWVMKYQQGKRIKLSGSTMDIRDPEETKHIWFSIDKINSIKKEIVYQKEHHSNIVKGFGVRFLSYTDQDYIFLNPKAKQYYKRLTVGFSFIDWENDDIGIRQINQAEFFERLQNTIKNKILDGGNLDTGDPTPPPSTDNRARLDVTDK